MTIDEIKLVLAELVEGLTGHIIDDPCIPLSSIFDEVDFLVLPRELEDSFAIKLEFEILKRLTNYNDLTEHIHKLLHESPTNKRL